ncbi:MULTISPECIES: YjdJ family protein [unclassified Psychrobacillus]|uniref:YjdJ family protein n=1 Tax=unclassified Psychrobacillus TaxID=2636677 RepID=UPI00146EE4E9|nr:YjdJ family protein [Psychrobacillus sp. BL-248-WT-3]NME04578.1 DUF4306 domain-containing protein [Psychrobacillus sp. BL-248-WT-3]
MKLFIQVVIGLMLLIFSTIASWYEGSTLTTAIWEWKHTAVFSKWINGSVNQANDILTIDYFIYAAKFSPAYPLTMLLSGTYLIILIGYILFRGKTKLFSYFLTSVGIVFLVLCNLVSGSPTIGLTIFFYSSLLIGILAIGVAIILLVTNKNKGITT